MVSNSLYFHPYSSLTQVRHQRQTNKVEFLFIIIYYVHEPQGRLGFASKHTTDIT
jgi:hypothetical protein